VSANKDKKGRGKGRDNVGEARALNPLDAPDTDEIVAIDEDEEPIPLKKKAFDSETTMIGAPAAIEKGRKSSRPVEEWDASPTANIPSGPVVEDGDRKTTVGAPPVPSVTQQRAAPSSMPPRPQQRNAPSIIPHDDSIKTSQAIRVVVWRDANGVHVAPAGTVVSAIKIDAMLVALEPTADLTAWLSRKER
jgi:hypothetical protein